MLMHAPSPGAHCQCRSFILSSTRSADARTEGIAFTALDGGQVGVIDLSRVECSTAGVSSRLWNFELNGQDIDLAGALKLSQLEVSNIHNLTNNRPRSRP